MSIVGQYITTRIEEDRCEVDLGALCLDLHHA